MFFTDTFLHNPNFSVLGEQEPLVSTKVPVSVHLSCSELPFSKT